PAQSASSAAAIGAGGSAKPEGPASAAASIPGATGSAKPAAPDPANLAQLRTTFDQRLGALEARGAGFWGGADYAAAKSRAAEAVGANDAGSPRLAEQRLNEALGLLSTVESKASQTLSSQLTTGDQALAAGQGDVAKQAYEYAKRIDPNNKRATDGLSRVR